MKTMILMGAMALVASSVAHAAEMPKTLVDPYLQIETALVNDTLDGIAANAKAIETAAAALGKDAEKLAASARKLEAAKDIAAARSAFGELSDALVTYADKTKSSFGDLRIAYCPMVNKPWVQKENEIKNPYFGASMISCGSFKK